MHIAFLFPGQGSQRPGMLHRLPDTTASATVLAEADLALRSGTRGGGAARGSDGRGSGDEDRLAGGIAELDTAEALAESPVALQLALLIAGVAGARALVEDEGVRPALVAGHGVGGYAAAVTAGVLTLEEALRAVRLRGELIRRAAEPEGDIAIRLAQHLATVRRRPQALPYVSGFHGRVLHDETNAVFDDLARSVAHPVRWAEMTAAIGAEGVTLCVEMPPGRLLSEHLAGGAPPVLRSVSVEEHGIAEAAAMARGDDDGTVGADGTGAGGGPEHAEQLAGRDGLDRLDGFLAACMPGTAAGPREPSAGPADGPVRAAEPPAGSAPGLGTGPGAEPGTAPGSAPGAGAGRGYGDRSGHPAPSGHSSAVPGFGSVQGAAPDPAASGDAPGRDAGTAVDRDAALGEGAGGEVDRDAAPSRDTEAEAGQRAGAGQDPAPGRGAAGEVDRDVAPSRDAGAEAGQGVSGVRSGPSARSGLA